MTATSPGAAVARAFDPEHDFPALVALIAAINAFDHVNWYPTPASLESEWGRYPAFDAARNVRVIQRDGQLVAATKVDWRDRGERITHRSEVWVHPQHRRRGHGRALLAWAEARSREAIDAGHGGPIDRPHVFRVMTGSDNPAGLAFAAAAGYTPIRYSFIMHRPLGEPIGDIPLPAGLELRPVTPDQYQAIWAADTEAFRDHWESAVRSEADYEEFVGHPDVDPTMWLVAWAGDEVAGSVINAIYRHENEQTGEEIGWLDHVSVRRPWRGRGLASALIVRSLELLRDRGMDVAALGVDAENPTGAQGVYERQGFRPHQRWVSLQKPVEPGAD